VRLFPFWQQVWRAPADDKVNLKQTRPQSSPLTAVNTVTRTDVAGTADRLEVSNTFIARPGVTEQLPHVEEDSTDIFLLERCSPLNDF
jgi:hypothetical protein